MKVLRGFLKVLSCAVYLMVVLALGLVAPILFGYQPAVVLSGSMEPDYPVGSVTYYQYAEFDEIAVGDVITFTLGTDSLATHRVVEIDQTAQTFVTKGDSNDSNDQNAVAYSEVQGKTVSVVIPWVGYFVVYAQSWQVIAIGGAILVLDLIFSKDTKKTTIKQA